MNDENPQTARTATPDSMRLLTLAVYVLYLLALPLGITAIIGVVMAYVGRADARGTAFESHCVNAIDVFWVFFIGMLIVVPLCFVLVGIPLLVALYIWVIYRTVKGLVRAVDYRPYW